MLSGTVSHSHTSGVRQLKFWTYSGYFNSRIQMSRTTSGVFFRAGYQALDAGIRGGACPEDNRGVGERSLFF